MPAPIHDPSERQTWPQLDWSALSTYDFAQRQNTALMAQTVAVLPLGATEQHGPHLPLSVDSAITEGIIASAKRQYVALPAQQRPPVLFLPLQAIGFSPEHASFPGTLTLSASTILALWNDIGASIASSGIRRLLMFNSHGGQVSVMDIVARQLRQQHGMLTYSSSWYQLPRPAALEASSTPHETRFGIHAGEEETAILLHLQPELVHMQRAQNFHSTSEDRAARYPILGNGKSAKMGWMMEDYNPQGAAGNASAATAEKGQQLVENAASQLLTLIAEISSLALPTK